MKTLDRQSLLLALIEGLRATCVSTTPTLMQKATYFLQELTRVPLSLSFVFHKYGPFSFELQDEITAMLANLILDLELQPDNRPCLVPGEMSGFLKKRGRVTITDYSPQLNFIVGKLSSMQIGHIDKLSAALYVWLQAGTQGNYAATRLSELKPRVSVSEASAALEEVSNIRHEAPATRPRPAMTFL